jgi:hypothetical protein
MSASQSGSPPDRSEAIFDSSDSPLLIIDGPWVSTNRPRRPNSPRYFPGREPPPDQPKPPEDSSDDQSPEPPTKQS